MNSLTKCKGLTLVELMISIVLGLIIIASVLQVLFNHRLMTNTERSLSRVQETGRLATNMLSKEIRKVGYHGCTNPAEMNIEVMAKTGVDSNFVKTSLRGFEVKDFGVFDPALISGDNLTNIQGTDAENARPNSDVIQLRYADRTGAKLAENTSSIVDNIKIDNNSFGFDALDFAIVADCKSASFFQITGVSTASGTDPITLSHAGTHNAPSVMSESYTTNADILAFRDITYFVGDTGRNRDGGIDVYALYRINGNNSTPEELIEGVEFMQVLYGEDLGSGNIRFVPASESGIDMQAVVAIKLALLIQDFDVALPEEDTRSYNLLGTNIDSSGDTAHSGGRYLRRPFTTTIQLRNARI